MAARFKKATYELVANVIKDCVVTGPQDDAARAAVAMMAAQFAKLFHDDNRSFDMERFHKACGFEQKE